MTPESLCVAGVERSEGVPTRPFGTCEQTLLFERREPAA